MSKIPRAIGKRNEKERRNVLNSLSPGNRKRASADDHSASSKDALENDSEPLTTSQISASTPPTMEDIDRWTYHTDLQSFGQNLQLAANAVFPNDKTSRYKVSMIMLS
jgi:hypothetical protein